MMLLVAADVAGRYLIGHPLPGAIELVQYAMVFVVFSALPTVTLKRRHISLDVLHDRLGGWARRLQWFAVCTSSAVVLGIESWLLFNRSQSMRLNEDVIGYLNLPVYPAGYFMCALTLISALVMLLAAAYQPIRDGAEHLVPTEA